MKNFGFAAFALGVAGAITAASKLNLEAKKLGAFPDTLPFFIAFFVLGIVGLVVWRIGTQKGQDAASQSSTLKGPDVYLRDIQLALEDFSAGIGKLSTEDICSRADTILSTYVLPFAEVRDQVVQRHGMSTGAEVLVTVAYGERMLNRVWSAASDGYPQESIAVLPEVQKAFAQAHSMMERLGG